MVNENDLQLALCEACRRELARQINEAGEGAGGAMYCEHGRVLLIASVRDGQVRRVSMKGPLTPAEAAEHIQRGITGGLARGLAMEKAKGTQH